MSLPSVRDYKTQIEAALQYSGDGSHTFDDIVAGVEDGSLQFWPGPSSVIVTQIVGRTLVFLTLGGGLADLEASTPMVLAWGKGLGCSRARMTGRDGWDRTFLARTGWTKQDQIVMEKKL